MNDRRKRCAGALRSSEMRQPSISSPRATCTRCALQRPGTPAETHANWRARVETKLGVLALSHLPPLPAGFVYQAWLLREGVWTSLGTAVPNADGRARIVAEDTAVASPRETVRVTIEPVLGSAQPLGRTVIAWPSGENAPHGSKGA